MKNHRVLKGPTDNFEEQKHTHVDTHRQEIVNKEEVLFSMVIQSQMTMTTPTLLGKTFFV